MKWRKIKKEAEMDPSSEWFLLGFNVDAELRGKLGGPPAVGVL